MLKIRNGKLMNGRTRISANQQSLNTKMMLAGMFGMNPLIPLEEVCDEFLSLSHKTALRKARVNELPFPALRLGKSQKAPWVVNIDDLAEYVEHSSRVARNDWQRAQV